MKRFFLFLYILLFFSCSHKMLDNDFAHTYMKCISIIEEYGYDYIVDNYFEIDLEKVGLFCDASDYMESLTGIKYHRTDVGIPIYESAYELQKDVQYLKWWYEKYGEKITKEEADSIVEKNYENPKVIPPNIDSVIVRWDRLQEKYEINITKEEADSMVEKYYRRVNF